MGQESQGSRGRATKHDLSSGNGVYNTGWYFLGCPVSAFNTLPETTQEQRKSNQGPIVALEPFHIGRYFGFRRGRSGHLSKTDQQGPSTWYNIEPASATFVQGGKPHRLGRRTLELPTWERPISKVGASPNAIAKFGAPGAQRSIDRATFPSS
jgi:hypothetical protein